MTPVWVRGATASCRCATGSSWIRKYYGERAFWIADGDHRHCVGQPLRGCPAECGVHGTLEPDHVQVRTAQHSAARLSVGAGGGGPGAWDADHDGGLRTRRHGGPLTDERRLWAVRARGPGDRLER